MRPSVGVQAGEIEIGRLIHVAAILRPQGKVFGEGVVSAGAINERALGFPRCTRKTAAGIAGRIKHEGSAAGKSVRLQPEQAGQFHHSFAGDLVNVGLHTP